MIIAKRLLSDIVKSLCILYDIILTKIVEVDLIGKAVKERMRVEHFVPFKQIVKYPYSIPCYVSKSESEEARFLFETTLLLYHLNVFLGILSVVISAVQS